MIDYVEVRNKNVVPTYSFQLHIESVVKRHASLVSQYQEAVTANDRVRQHRIKKQILNAENILEQLKGHVK